MVAGDLLHCLSPGERTGEVDWGPQEAAAGGVVGITALALRTTESGFVAVSTTSTVLLSLSCELGECKTSSKPSVYFK